MLIGQYLLDIEYQKRKQEKKKKILLDLETWPDFQIKLECEFSHVMSHVNVTCSYHLSKKTKFYDNFLKYVEVHFWKICRGIWAEFDRELCIYTTDHYTTGIWKCISAHFDIIFVQKMKKKEKKKANYFWAGLPFIPFSVPHDLGLEQFQLFAIKWHKIWLGHRLINPEGLFLTFLFNACLATCILNWYMQLQGLYGICYMQV